MDVKLPYEPLVDLGKGEPIILLHGLFGGLSNWRSVIEEFFTTHRVLFPRLPLHANPITKQRLENLVDYLDGFIVAHGFNKVVLIGNSLGGHIALLYALKKMERVEKLVLTGSSGLFENSFGGTYPHVKDYNYIKEKVESTFFKRDGLACANQRNNMSEILKEIKVPTLLVWGLQDTTTPPNVALEFHELLPYSTLAFIENCAHVPMMEQPESFNEHLRIFLQQSM